LSRETRRYRVLLRRTTVFEEYVFATSEHSAEELAWEQWKSRDDPEPYVSDMCVIGVDEQED